MTLNNTTYSKTEIVDALKKQSAIVTFTKKDGTERVMKCTLKSDLLPAISLTEQVATGDDVVKIRKVSDTSVAVYDLDNAAWKSFRLDSITSFNVTE
jgi:hypothetical protein